jgi:adenylosuccinate synthase
MPVTAVFGAQWGDEGKGKVVDFLAENADFVVRYQGGSNAGHTINIGDERYALRLTPSGVLQGATGVIANGVVLDAHVLRGEIGMLEGKGVAVRDRLKVSDRAQLVLPVHGPMDRALDASRNDLWRNNTTGRGISTCMGDKHRYEGFRVADLLSDRVRADRLRYLLERGNTQLRALGADPVDVDEAVAECESWVDLLRPLTCDTGRLLRDACAAGKRILLEGAQAALLDVDFGTYPFVSSSSTGANGIPSGTGLPARAIDRVVAVAKAYVTRVGSDAGPFPTRLDDETGQRMQERGKEFGTVTGRPRRCGWFDAVSARHVCETNGVDALAITKIDVLQGIDPLRVCVAYEVDGRRLDGFPADIDLLQRARPVYRDVAGFGEEIAAARAPGDLPPTARAYLDVLAEEVGVPVEILSVGPERSETVTLEAQ